MRKVFISSLGTKKYIECVYVLNGRKSSLVSHIQEAFIDILCKDWNKNDLILILCTKEAEKNNWKDRKDFGQGLESRLKQLSITPEIKMILIPDGKSKEEAAEIFNILFKEIKEGDRIFMDLTHAVRTLPVVQIMAAMYTKSIKNVEINGLYYGALEAFGTVERLKKIKPEERVIPILDLTSFAHGLDFTSAISCISQNKTFEHLKTLTDQGSNLINLIEGNQNEPDKVSALLEKIEEIYLALYYAESKTITEKYFVRFDNEIPLLFKPLIQPLNFLFSDSRQKNALLLKGFESAKWCLKRNLIIQALVFAIETTLTELCNVCDPKIRRDDWNNILISITRNGNSNNNKKKLLDKGRFLAQDLFKGIVFGKVKPRNRKSTLQFLEKCKEEAEFKCKYKGLTREQMIIVNKYGDRLVPLAKAYSKIVTIRNTLISGGWENSNNKEINPRRLTNICEVEIDNLLKVLKNFVEQCN